MGWQATCCPAGRLLLGNAPAKLCQPLSAACPAGRVLASPGESLSMTHCLPSPSALETCMRANGHPWCSTCGDVASQRCRPASASSSFEMFILCLVLKSSLPCTAIWCWEAWGFPRAVAGTNVFQQAAGALGYYGNVAVRAGG